MIIGFQELLKYKSLRQYGIFLGLLQVITFFFMFPTETLQNAFSDPSPVCFPFYENCSAFLPFLKQNISLIQFLFLSTSICATVLFCFDRTLRPALLFLQISVLIKLIVHFHSYRFMGNYHFMPYIVFFIYFFIKDKIRLIPTSIVLFYVVAASLKFNIEWISGSALLRPLPIGKNLLYLATSFVIFLELFLSWGLLSQTFWFWISFLFFILFHLISFLVVGYYYMSIMFCLLAIFVLARYYRNTEPFIFEQLLQFKFPRSFIYAGLLALVLNLYSFFFFQDPAITGEGRIFTLNMLDAYSSCQPQINVHMKNATYNFSEPRSEFSVRAQCDPVVYYFESKNLCRAYANEPGFRGVSLQLISKRKTDESFWQIIDQENMCDPKIKFSSWLKNDWITYVKVEN